MALASPFVPLLHLRGEGGDLIFLQEHLTGEAPRQHSIRRVRLVLRAIPVTFLAGDHEAQTPVRLLDLPRDGVAFPQAAC